MVDGINFDIQSPGVHAPLDLHTIVGKGQYGGMHGTVVAGVSAP